MASFDHTSGTLFTWFRQSASRHPDAVAIEVRGSEVTYRELLELAERLATRLVDAVGGRPSAVGLLTSRSLEAFAGYLAALRLGATVVPLDPAFPVTRNRSMCFASHVDTIVVDDAGFDGAEDVVRDTAIVPVAPKLATHREELPEPYDAPFPGAHDDIAYILFTSGSTGTPKGVPIRHRNLGQYLAYCVDRYDVSPGCRLSQTFGMTFDLSVFDMFVAWCSGATLVVPESAELLSPVRFVTERRITHWFSVPSVVSIARRLRLLRPGAMPGLRWSLFCGEQLPLAQAREWAEAAPNSTIENLYGPTEVTITCAGYRLPSDPAQWPKTSNGTVPIGQVYPHLDALVRTEDGTGEGELCLRGVQRFDGYLDPAQNAGRFITSTSDWYRTGDRVRYENGELVHLGRLDDQLKINGYRIELGEIEAVLREDGDVHDVVVLALPTKDGQTVLHAVYTGRTMADSDLAAVAAARLPKYMLPWSYQWVDHFPLNSNGKIDRRRLAEEFSPEAENRAS